MTRKKKNESGVVREWKERRSGEIKSRRKKCPKMEKKPPKRKKEFERKEKVTQNEDLKQVSSS